MTVAEVRLWGRRIGAVAVDGPGRVAAFEYDAQFCGSGIQVAPLTMPLGEGVFRFPGLGRDAFHGLPGLLADSLPDKFGNAVIDAWLAARGRAAAEFDPVERLCTTGARGMGALEYRPRRGPHARTSTPLDVGELVELASAVLAHREGLRADLGGPGQEEALREILRVSSSAGGARAKAVIAWNPESGEVRSGQVSAPEGFEYWLLKFDGVQGNRDREWVDPQGYGAIEYAYSRMARAAGIEMTACRLLEEGGRRHFMTRRFDRTAQGHKLHMQTLGALAHLDYNLPGAYSYEQAFAVLDQLDLGPGAREQLFRRMLFNVLARNQDDHVKNIAFLMDPHGVWRLAPAYDLTYSYNPSGAWTARHQMTIQGKRDDFTREDLASVARLAGISPGRAASLHEELRSALDGWHAQAAEAGVPEEVARGIAAAHRQL
jgi:serine/threonine-protein kinase HipA